MMNKDTVIEKGTINTVTSDRHMWIGGSDIPAILNKSTFGDVFDLTVGKFKDILDLPVEEEDKFFMDKYIDYGNMMEEKIRKWYNRKHGYKFLEACAKNEALGYRANVDGFDFDKKVLCEIKTHGKTLRIEEYEMQCQFYMMVFGVDETILLMYEREDSDNPMEYFVERFDSKRLTSKIVKRDDEFIDHMKDNITKYGSVCQQFVNSHGKMSREEVNNAMIDDSIRNELIEQSNHMAILESKVAEYEKVKKEYDSMKADMLKSMEKNGVYALETNDYKFSYVDASTSSSFDKKGLGEDHPELLEKYTTTKPKAGYIRMSKKKK